MKKSALARIAAALILGLFLSAFQADTEYSYDDLGRVIRVEYPNENKVVTYEYDAAGNRIEVETAWLTNTAPLAQTDSITTDEDQVHDFNPLLNDSDPELDPIAVISNTSGAKGVVTIINNGQGLRYAPNANANGADSFTYTISDGALNSSPATVSVTVNAVNDPPVAANDVKSTNEDTVITFDPRGNDSDVEGATLTIIAKTNGAKGTVAIVSAGAQLRYTPNANANGSDSFTYTISDGSLTDQASVSMTINAVNDPPVANTDSYETLYQTTKKVWPLVNDTDVEGNPLTITAKTNGAKGTVSITDAGQTLTYVPNSGASGADSFAYTISDGNGGTDVGTVNFTIGQQPNTPPTAVNDSAFMPTNFTSITISVLNNDSDPDAGDSIHVASKTNGQSGNVTIGAGGQNVTYMLFTPHPQQGMDTFTYTISDLSGATDTATVTVSWGSIF